MVPKNIYVKFDKYRVLHVGEEILAFWNRQDQTRPDKIRLDADYEQDGLGRGEAHQVLQGEVWREDRRVLGGGVDEVGAQGSEACPAQGRGVLATFNLRRRALRVRVLVADRVSGRSVQGAVGQGVRLRAPVQEAPAWARRSRR